MLAMHLLVSRVGARCQGVRALGSSSLSESLGRLDSSVSALEKRRLESRAWREGGVFLSELRRLGQDSAVSRQEVRLAIMVGLRRGTLKRPAHFTASLRALGDKGDAAGAQWLLETMRSLPEAAAVASTTTYNAALRACGRARDGPRARALLAAMEAGEGGAPSPDGVSYGACIDACGTHAEADGDGRSLLDRAIALRDPATAAVACRAATRQCGSAQGRVAPRGLPFLPPRHLLRREMTERELGGDRL